MALPLANAPSGLLSIFTCGGITAESRADTHLDSELDVDSDSDTDTDPEVDAHTHIDAHAGIDARADGADGVASTPAAVAELPAAAYTSLAAGHTHSLALTLDGVLFAWGVNSHGQLGFSPPGGGGSYSPHAGDHTPIGASRIHVPDAGGASFSSMAAGAYHSLALTRDGRLFSWGSNSHGQLGRTAGAGLPAHLPREVALSFVGEGDSAEAQGGESAAPQGGQSVAPQGGQSVAPQGGQSAAPQGGESAAPQGGQSAAGRRPRALAAGAFHSLLLLDDGSLCAWGDNSMGQLGRARASRSDACAVAADIVQISSGEMHSVALTRDGKVLTWGSNTHHQLGRGDELILSTPGAVPLPMRFGELAVEVEAGGYRTVVRSNQGRTFVLPGLLAEEGQEDDYLDDF